MAQKAFNTQLLVTSQGVAELLSSSRTKKEFDQHCETIMAANGGRLPGFWFQAVIASGLADECQRRFDVSEKQDFLKRNSLKAVIKNNL